MLLKRFQASDKRVRQIKRRIRSYSVISFDIFDTLILRRVLKPSDVFRLMAPEVLKILSKSKNKSIDFPLERMKAERDARRDLMIRDGGDKAFEINFAQIYAQLQKNLKLTDKQTQQIQKLELETELKCCVVHPKIKQVYDYCIQQKKQVWFVSDMYLSKSDIIKILKNAGYKHKDISKNVIVSSEYNATKHNGNLFKVLLEKSKAHPRYILHIGDSLKADVLGARKNKIRSSYLRKLFKPHHKKHHKYSLSKSVQIALQDINKLEDKDYFSNLGYSLIGPLMLQFCHWIYKDVKKRGIKKIYFLSRDGYLPYEAFKILFGHDKEVEPIYLFASRRANGFNIFLKKGAKKLEKDDLESLKSIFNLNSSLRESFALLNFNISKYRGALKDFDLDIDKPLLSYNNLIKAYKVLFLLHKEIFTQLLNTQSNFRRYLKYQGLGPSNNQAVALVDSFTRGNTQRLFSSYKISPKIHGYYFVLIPGVKQTLKGVNTFLSDINKLAPRRLWSPSFLENFVSSCGRSLSHVDINNEGPKLTFIPRALDKVTFEKFALLRQGALNFILGYNNFNANYESTDIIFFIEKIARLTTFPSKEDAINLGYCMVDEFYGKYSPRRFFIEFPAKYGFIPIFKYYIRSKWRCGYYKLLPLKYKILILPAHAIHLFQKHSGVSLKQKIMKYFYMIFKKE